MTVTYLTAGINIIPTSPNANTIYVLGSGSYTNATQIAPAGNCTAMIGTGNVVIQTTANANANIYLSSKWNNIIDNIRLDATYNGTGGTHIYNSYALDVNAGGNNTINNTKTFNANNY